MLKLKNICKKLSGKNILSNISFEVDEGEIFGYLGPNGAGKTTTIRIILGLYKPDSGDLKIIDNSIDRKIKNKIGFMLETDGLYGELTLTENLKLYADIYNLDFRTIQNIIDDLLKKYDLIDMKQEKIAKFSKGMKQKLAFIRSIIHKPKLLILDEPFNSLDPDMQSIMREHLLQLSKKHNTTIFFSTHNLYEVERICDKIAIIKDGEIKLSENIKNIKSLDQYKNMSLEDIYFSITK